MQRMKQLARPAVYWPRTDQDIERISQTCTACAEFQKRPAKPAIIHPWMLPKKPWSRLHIHHGISLLDYDWLVLVDTYSRYSCIHMTGSTSTKTSIELLEQDFSTLGILTRWSRTKQIHLHLRSFRHGARPEVSSTSQERLTI